MLASNLKVPISKKTTKSEIVFIPNPSQKPVKLSNFEKTMSSQPKPEHLF